MVCTHLLYVYVYLFLCALILCEVAVKAQVLYVNLNSRAHTGDPTSPVRLIFYCDRCPNPGEGGSVALGLLPRYGIRDYDVTGQVIYCIPNFVENEDRIVNQAEFVGRIVLVDRGIVSLQEKALGIQNARAMALIIADDGKCNESFQFCGPRAGSVMEGGFAAHDEPQSWENIHIPVLLVTSETADNLRALMKNKKVDIPRIGMHNVTLFDDQEL